MNKPVSKKKRVLKIIGIALSLLIGLWIIMAIIGSLTSTKVIEVKRVSKNATPAQLWDYWSSTEKSKQWDGALEWGTVDGPFQLGQTGEIKVKDQAPRKYEVIEFEENKLLTQRFFLPFWNKMDWRHTLVQTPAGVEVTYIVEVSGPSSFILAPIMKSILEAEIPATVDKFIEVAEGGQPVQ